MSCFGKEALKTVAVDKIRLDDGLSINNPRSAYTSLSSHWTIIYFKQLESSSKQRILFFMSNDWIKRTITINLVLTKF